MRTFIFMLLSALLASSLAMAQTDGARAAYDRGLTCLSYAAIQQSVDQGRTYEDPNYHPHAAVIRRWNPVIREAGRRLGKDEATMEADFLERVTATHLAIGRLGSTLVQGTHINGPMAQWVRQCNTEELPRF